MRAIIVLLLLTLHSPVSAEDITFYEKETDKFWAVFGTADTETGQATTERRLPPDHRGQIGQARARREGALSVLDGLVVVVAGIRKHVPRRRVEADRHEATIPAARHKPTTSAINAFAVHHKVWARIWAPERRASRSAEK